MKIKIHFQILLLGAALGWLAGCAATGPAYSGARQPREKVALLSTEPTVNIQTVDGRRVRPVIFGEVGLKNLEVLPGEHTLVVTYINNDGFDFHVRSTEAITVPFHAQAGHAYVVVASSDPNATNKIVFMVKDVTEAAK